MKTRADSACRACQTRRPDTYLESLTAEVRIIVGSISPRMTLYKPGAAPAGSQEVQVKQQQRAFEILRRDPDLAGVPGLGIAVMAGYVADGEHFAHANVLGSETHMTDWAGNDAQAILYYPWGQVWSNPSGFYPNTVYQIFAPCSSTTR